MIDLLNNAARKVWPELDQMDAQTRLPAIGDVLSAIYGLPLALGGLVWLVAVTDLTVMRQEWQTLLLMMALIVLLSRLTFFLIVEIRAGRYANADGSLDGLVLWSAVFLYGPSALWLGVLGSLVNLGLVWRNLRARDQRWFLARNLILGLTTSTLVPLTALSFYRRWGGVYPLPQLAGQEILIANGTLLANFILFLLAYLGFILYTIFSQNRLSGTTSTRSILRFLLLALALPHLAHPFGILAAGIYAQNGEFAYLFFMSGMFMVAVIARQLSRAAESSRQQSRQMEKLEELGRAIIKAPPDASILSDLLSAHVPLMFPSSRIAIWVQANEFLLLHPPDWRPTIDRFWEWLQVQPGAQTLLEQDEIPWSQDASTHPPVVISPIFDVESLEPIGGIYIELQTLVQPWDARTLNRLLPAAQSLAGQVASALREAKIYEESLDHQRLTQELKLAGQIQDSFLPKEFPIPPGWELAVTILPARETSGDYFDFIPLSDGRLGILIADVADKGVGPALYMAMSRTLIRTYAREFALDPDVVFFAANGRILEDARANLFVTAFYAVLDPQNGTLIYSNAGHNPPYLIRTNRGREVRTLATTGIPIGIEPGAVWHAETVQIDPGDVLLLYTDGIPDAQNGEGRFFGQKNLLEAAKAWSDTQAQEIQAGIIRRLQDFVGDAPQVDDITLMVLVRGTELQR